MDLKLIYGENANIQEKKQRIEDLKKAFFDGEGFMPEKTFSSPGRAEIIGNHTDHNNGLVMVASISCDILAVVSKRDDLICKICSKEYGEIKIDLSNTKVDENEYGSSAGLVRGVANALKEKGLDFKGFTAYTTSNIFKGAGVSSSAAFEVLIVEIFNNLYLNSKIDNIERAVIAKYAENVYFNKPCGLLDQSGISIGSLIKIDFKDTQKPQITKLDALKGYTIVLTNTGGDHLSLTKYYSSIREEMHSIANYFGKTVLNDISYSEFLSQVHNLKLKFSSRSILRAMHFYRENQRVLLAQKSLEENDAETFLKQINDSGISSLCVLQNCYVDGQTHQPVVLGIEYSRSIIKNGGVRVHGGGFAGSILAFVKDDELDFYVSSMKKVFGDENVFVSSIRSVGTTLIE